MQFVKAHFILRILKQKWKNQLMLKKQQDRFRNPKDIVWKETGHNS